MGKRGLTANERTFAEQNIRMISDFLVENNYSHDDYYGDAAVGFLRAIQFCFQFSSFTYDQFEKIADLFMRESVKAALPTLEIISLDDIQEEPYCLEENITEQTICIAAEQFMNEKIVDHLLMTASSDEKKIMELICSGVPNDQILYSQGISQTEYDAVLENIRSRVLLTA